VRPASPDLVSLVAGVCIAALGVVLLLEQLGHVELRFAAMAPAVIATIGAILLASGLGREP
jgi:ABC-type enterobactin transport system permease subunit